MSDQIQQPIAGPSASVWEQDVPVGGEDVAGHGASIAVATVPQGVQTVRDVPTVAAASNSVTVAANTSQRVVGKTPQRRRITIIASIAAGAMGDNIGRLNVEQGLADGPGIGATSVGVGLIVPNRVPVPLQSSGEVWFRAAAGAVEVTYWAEIDQG